MSCLVYAGPVAMKCQISKLSEKSNFVKTSKRI
jgi:hypothetical protein